MSQPRRDTTAHCLYYKKAAGVAGKDKPFNNPNDLISGFFLSSETLDDKRNFQKLASRTLPLSISVFTIQTTFRIHNTFFFHFSKKIIKMRKTNPFGRKNKAYDSEFSALFALSPPLEPDKTQNFRFVFSLLPQRIG